MEVKITKTNAVVAFISLGVGALGGWFAQKYYALKHTPEATIAKLEAVTVESKAAKEAAKQAKKANLNTALRFKNAGININTISEPKMDLSEDIKQDKSHISEWIESDKNYLSNYKINKEKKEIFLNSSNDYSELKQSYNNTQLKNISIDFGFPNTMNSYKYKRSFPIASPV